MDIIASAVSSPVQTRASAYVDGHIKEIASASPKRWTFVPFASSRAIV
ncbi:MAG: hypothetical protein FWC71_02665 [Defluviitaleaceae bacterium]|nr:hypothetical protein [Defluviitaleaceae bacterium]